LGFEYGSEFPIEENLPAFFPLGDAGLNAKDALLQIHLMPLEREDLSYAPRHEKRKGGDWLEVLWQRFSDGMNLGILEKARPNVVHFESRNERLLVDLPCL
jgi:hypothetical protein